MSDATGIEWTDATWNPIVGCSVVSPGCTNCYAMRMAARVEAMFDATHTKAGRGAPFTPSPYAGTTMDSKAGPVWTGKVAIVDDYALTKPLRWRKSRRIFVNSMGDLFHESVPDGWIDRVFAVMALAPQHTFQVLTKRTKRMRDYFNGPWPNRDGVAARIAEATLEFAPTRANLPLPPTIVEVPVGPRLPSGEPEFGFRRMLGVRSWPLPNVWLGASVEDQTRADERIPDLLATPAAVRFISAEPLLGAIDLREVIPNPINYSHAHGFKGLDWIICGGESGLGARPMHPDWARSLRDQCAAAGVPFFFKQWGEWHTNAFYLPDQQPVFRQFTSFDHWVNKARTWVNGGICLDRTGRRLQIGGDFMRARDENTFPVTIMHHVGKARAGRLLDGVEHNGFPK